MPLNPDLGGQRYDEFQEEFADKIIETWARYCPNMTRRNIIARHIYTARDYACELINMKSGDIFMGAFNAGQVMYNHFGYRSPIANLYNTGSAGHPALTNTRTFEFVQSSANVAPPERRGSADGEAVLRSNKNWEQRQFPSRHDYDWRRIMKTRLTIAVSMLAGAVIGGAAIQALHAQAKPPVYMIAINEISGRTPKAGCGKPT